MGRDRGTAEVNADHPPQRAGHRTHREAARQAAAALRARRRRKVMEMAAVSTLFAMSGMLFGAGAALFSATSAGLRASAANAAALDLHEAPLTGLTQVLGNQFELERLHPGEQRAERSASAVAARPRIVLIFDDMGLDQSAFERVMAMPGPVTLSFLPYGRAVQRMADKALLRGDAVMLHLPMEPEGAADPGPLSLRKGMAGVDFLELLNASLSSFQGYIAVNNHMGSRLTKDEAAMKTILSVLAERGLVFVDSLTTARSVASKAGDAVGAQVFVRDVFLDADQSRSAIRRQISLAETIARKTGLVIVICHPRPETLDLVGPWLTTAPARGFELATIAEIGANDQAVRAQRVAVRH